MIDPADPPTFGKLLDWAWAGVLALVGIIWRKNEAEMSRQRDHIAKIFDKIDDSTRKSEEGRAEMLKTIHGMHTELLRELNHKVDK